MPLRRARGLAPLTRAMVRWPPEDKVIPLDDEQGASDMTIRFDGRTAIVTGAGQGLGRSHALALAARGAKVVVNDLGVTLDGSDASHSAADTVVEEIKGAGGEAVASYDSVSEPAAAARIVDRAVDAFGAVDILVNNAGILRDKTFKKMPLADYELVIKVHLLGSVYVTKAAFPRMLEQGYGRIVMTTSASGLYGNFGQTNYGAAKLGLVGLMNGLKEEGKRDNVLVNTIAPVAFTRMGETIFGEELKAQLRPEYVSAAVAYLCSEACTETGRIIAAGAGLYARVQMLESAGWRLPDGAEPSPEAVAEHMAEISDMGAARAFENAGEATLRLFE